jgi:hypothetical protein
MDRAERIREIWAKFFGFNPRVLATFDHLTAGFPSRIVVGYALLHLWWKEARKTRLAPAERAALDARRAKAKHDERVCEPLVSLVLDTVLPMRDPCGASLELGVVEPSAAVGVERPDVFWFRNQAQFNWTRIRARLEEGVLAALSQVNWIERSRWFVQAMGGFATIEHFWRDAHTPAELLAAREALMRGVGPRRPFAGKLVFMSDTLPVQAEVLEFLASSGLDLSECPGVKEVGVARRVNVDGTEGELVYEWSPDLAAAIARKDAIPTGPLQILSFAPFPHFGNDHGYLASTAAWAGLSFEQLTNMGESSWSPGVVMNASRKTESAHADLLVMDAEAYQRAISDSVRDREPKFEFQWARRKPSPPLLAAT